MPINAMLINENNNIKSIYMTRTYNITYNIQTHFYSYFFRTYKVDIQRTYNVCPYFWRYKWNTN